MKDETSLFELTDEQLTVVTGGSIGSPTITVNTPIQTNVSTETNTGVGTNVNNILFSNVQNSNVGQTTIDQINAARQGNHIS